MTSSRKPGFVLPVAVTLAGVLGLYFAAYYWLLVPPTLPAPREAIPIYRVDGHLIHGYYCWEIVFRPAHWLDRRIRPRVWESKP